MCISGGGIGVWFDGLTISLCVWKSLAILDDLPMM